MMTTAAARFSRRKCSSSARVSRVCRRLRPPGGWRESHAYDTRPVVEEQVKSLGAQFLKIDVGETGQTKDGYAKALTGEQIQKQRDAMKKVCGDSDVVITAAQVFGRRAPILVTAEMLNAMKPGSVVVDLAIETGGNVEGAQFDKVTDRNGVKIVGIANLPGRVPMHASQVYSANLTSLVEEFWDKQNKTSFSSSTMKLSRAAW